MKQYNEMGDEPEWLKGCDWETHLLYWQDMGALAQTQNVIEADLVIWDGAHFFVHPTRTGSAMPEQGTLQLTFKIEFPSILV